MRRHTLLLISVLILAFAVRLIQLGERNFWYDEAFSALYGSQSVQGIVEGTISPVAGGAADIHPLLYYLSLKAWMSVFGFGAFVVRLWSVLIGTATILAVYGLAKELFDPRTAIAAALVTAIAPFHVQYSQEARMYAFMGLFLTLAAWAFVRAYRSSRRAWGWWIGFGMCAALAMYAQQLSAFFLAALAVIPVFARKPRAIVGVIVGAIAALLLYLPWLLVLPSQFSQVAQGYWIEVPNAARMLLTLRSFFVGSLDIPPPASLIGFVAALVLVIFLVVQVILRRRRQTTLQQGSTLIVLWLAFAPMVGLWLFSQVRPLYLDRGLIGSAILLYIGIGWLFARGGLPRPILALLAMVGFTAVAIGLTSVYSWSTFPNSPFRQMTEYVASRVQPGDIVLHQDKTSALPAIYYARAEGLTLEQRYLADEPGSPDDTLLVPTQIALGLIADQCIEAAAQNASRVWWVMYAFAPEQYAAAGVETLQQDMDWLNANYNAAETLTIRDLQIVLYTDRRTPADTGACPS